MEKLLIIFACTLLSNSVVAKNISTTEESPDKTVSITTQCMENDVCSAKIVVVGKKFPIIQGAREPGISWIDKNQAIIIFSCGSPCSTYYFFDKEKGISNPISNPLTWNLKINCAVLVDEKFIASRPIYGSDKILKKILYTSLKPKPYEAADMINSFDKEKSTLNDTGTLKTSYQNNKNDDIKMSIDNFCRK